jgi:hypothetical protein
LKYTCNTWAYFSWKEKQFEPCVRQVHMIYILCFYTITQNHRNCYKKSLKAIRESKF